MSGQKPSANNTPAYISAQNAYNRISPYLSATPDILASAVSTQKVTSDDL